MFIAKLNSMENFKPDDDAVSIPILELLVYDPWFICEVEEYETGNPSPLCLRAYLISNLETLRELAQSTTLVNVYVVSPGYINNSDGWCINRLLRISRAEYFHEDHKSYIYRFYVERDMCIDVDISGFNKNRSELNFVPILDLAEIKLE